MADANIHDHGTAPTRRLAAVAEPAPAHPATLVSAIDQHFGQVETIAGGSPRWFRLTPG
jgi:hypothetical protein